MELKNSDGSTLLHVATTVDNTKAINILVAKERDLLITKDNMDQIPLAIVISNMYTETLGVCLITSIQEQRSIGVSNRCAIGAVAQGLHLKRATFFIFAFKYA